MRKQYDDFTQMKLKDMCKSMSDMTYTYINPDSGEPTKVPPSHYEKILEAVKENYMGEITSWIGYTKLDRKDKDMLK